MKRVFTLLLLLMGLTSFSQANQPWRSFFSYNDIRDLSQSNSRIYAGAENAMFSQNVLTGEAKTVTSVDGLKTETISAIHHSAYYNKTLVGNENGLLLIVNDDNTIISRIDIIEEATVPANKKRINHILEYEGKAYISCDFGITVFDIASLEFGDTYYIGNNGDEIAVMQCAVHNGYLYAATQQNGIRRGLLSNPNLIDFNQWTEEASGQWVGIASFSNNLFAANTNGTLQRLQNGTFTFFSQQSSVVDLRSTADYLIVTAPNAVKIYNGQLILSDQVDFIPGEFVTFTCSTVVNGKIYIGTREKGVFTFPLNNHSFVQNITPDGPLRSNIFSLEKTPNFLWAVFGGYDYFYQPDYAAYGISKLTPEGWLDIPFSEVLGALSLSDIVASPGNENEVFIASHQTGLLKVEDDVPTHLYTQLNTGPNGLQSLILPGDPSYKSVRINGPAFDQAGNLWMTNAMIEKPLKVLKSGGEWASYSFNDVTQDPKDDNYGKLVIDKNGTKWIPTRDNGIVAFNEALGNKFVVIGESDGLPNTYVKCLAIDNRNQLWIGTIKGLRILSSVDRFTTENQLTTTSIIIMEDGIAQELMYEQVITDIEVDGANNKWMATAQSGAFLVSPNGQETLAHFTKQNSPLPSNVINDIEIDPATGEVFFATDKGMVSYKGTSTEAEGDLNNVYVFPNPVRPGFEGDVNISGLMDNVNVKITDIEGNLVYETTSEGGTVLWDTRAFGKYKVASGVYMIFLASDDGAQTKVKKVMIIR